MKKIILSIAIIGIVGVATAGMTFAYFSDDETSVGNTFTAGTIDIKVDGTNPWTETYTIPDIKPGETDYINFGIENVGENPAEIYKSIYGMIGTGGDDIFCGVSSQPEFKAEVGAFLTSGACNKSDWSSVDDIETQILYDLSVKIYETKAAYSGGSGTPIWWQTIETGERTLPTVYPTETSFIDLGMLPVGGYMFVEQSYHFNPDAGNVYQGDILTFNMKIVAEQLAQGTEGNATVTLENKTAAPEYAVIADTYNGVLTYKTKNPTFDFSFTGITPLTAEYTLVVGSDPWVNKSSACVLGVENFYNSNSITLAGTATCPSMTSAKAWLIPTVDWDTWGSSIGNWNQSNYLLEIGLVNYTKN